MMEPGNAPAGPGPGALDAVAAGNRPAIRWGVEATTNTCRITNTCALDSVLFLLNSVPSHEAEQHWKPWSALASALDLVRKGNADEARRQLYKKNPELSTSGNPGPGVFDDPKKTFDGWSSHSAWLGHLLDQDSSAFHKRCKFEYCTGAACSDKNHCFKKTFIYLKTVDASNKFEYTSNTFHDLVFNKIATNKECKSCHQQTRVRQTTVVTYPNVLVLDFGALAAGEVSKRQKFTTFPDFVQHCNKAYKLHGFIFADGLHYTALAKLDPKHHLFYDGQQHPNGKLFPLPLSAGDESEIQGAKEVCCVLYVAAPPICVPESEFAFESSWADGWAVSPPNLPTSSFQKF